jgi:hypothetical protein
MGLTDIDLRVGRLYRSVSNEKKEFYVRLIRRDSKTGRFRGSDGHEYWMDGRARGATGVLRTITAEVSEAIRLLK